MGDKRPPGRPRSESARQAILAAAADLVAADGYAATTIDAIAARAGVGKQTIYRWWPTKADVVLDASATGRRFAVPVVDHGSYADDLHAFLTTAYKMANRAKTADLLRALMVEAQLRPDFGERFRDTYLRPRREAFGEITARAAERGDLPPHPAADVVAEIVFGTLWYRLLATEGRLTPKLADELVATLT